MPWWTDQTLGNIRVTALPFYGEWFGPGSSFDGNIFLAQVNGRTVLGTVDADQDENGNMESVFHRLASSGNAAIDYLFFCCTGQRHRCPSFCGSPFWFSNTFGRDHAHRMRFHPDRHTIARWCGILKPKFIVPYAEFIFHNDAARSEPLVLDDSFQSNDYFQSYWESGIGAPAEWLIDWKDQLEQLRAEVAKSGTQLVMMGPGETIQA
jgi:hypothetical protein